MSTQGLHTNTPSTVSVHVHLSVGGKPSGRHVIGCNDLSGGTLRVNVQARRGQGGGNARKEKSTTIRTAG